MKLSLITETDPKLQEVSEEWDFEKDGDPNELVKEMIDGRLEELKKA